MIGSFVLGGLLLLGFLAWERRAPQPMVPPAFFRSRAFSAGNAAGFLLTAALFGAVFFLAQFMQAAFGSGPLKAGLQLLPWTATLFLVAPVAGRLVDRIGERPLVVTGLTLQAAGMFWIGSGRRRHGPLLRTGAAAHHGRLRRLDGDAGDAERRHRRAAPRSRRDRLRHLQHDAAARRCRRGRRTGRGVRRRRGLRRRSPPDSARALAVCGVLSLLGALAGLGIAMRRRTDRVRLPSGSWSRSCG